MSDVKVIDLSKVAAEASAAKAAATQIDTPPFAQESTKQAADRPKSYWDFPKASMAELSLCNVRVDRPTRDQNQSNNEQSDKPQILCNISFGVVLDTKDPEDNQPRWVLIRGAKLKLIDKNRGPFFSMEGFPGTSGFIPYVWLAPEQIAFLVRYAVKEMETWTEQRQRPEMVQDAEAI